MDEQKNTPDPRSKLLKSEITQMVISSSPHINTDDTVPKIMWTVFFALLPVIISAVIFFGIQSLILIIICIASALLTEYFINIIKKESTTISDGSAAITGLLLALTLPPSFTAGNCIICVIGSVFAIAVGKQIFGGLGYNIFNPALLARAFLQASFPVSMTSWVYPLTAKYANIDSLTAATPLGIIKFEGKANLAINYFDMFTGNIGGSLGETSALAIMIGGVFLLLKRYADWRIPVSFLGSVFIIGGFFWLLEPDKYPDPLFHLLSGGLFLGAFFMATDMVTSPVTPMGSWIFGIGSGLLSIVIRIFGGIPEGVMYSILIMNAVTPLINKYTKPKIFGERMI